MNFSVLLSLGLLLVVSSTADDFTDSSFTESFLNSTQTVSCYQCNSLIDANCFNVNAGLSKDLIKPCSPNQTFCRKIVQTSKYLKNTHFKRPKTKTYFINLKKKVKNEVSVIRQCTSQVQKSIHDSHCYSTPGKSAQSVCECRQNFDGDPCNSSQFLRGSVLIIFAFLTYSFIHWF